MNRADVRHAFGPNAAAYGKAAPHADVRGLREVLLKLEPIQRGLDIATGGGHTAGAIAEVCPVVVAADFTPEMLNQARGTYPTIVPVESDAMALPFASGAFDFVASRFAPHHFPSLTKFVTEVARVLRVGGHFYTLDCSAPKTVVDLMDRVETLRDPSHGHDWTQAEWLTATSAVGLQAKQARLLGDRYELPAWYDRLKTPPEAQAKIRALLEAQLSNGLTYDLDGPAPYIESFKFEGLFVKH